MKALKQIIDATELLKEELKTAINNKAGLCTEDKVFGYVINTEDDKLVEAEIKDIAIVNDEIYVFMTETDDETNYSTEEKIHLLINNQNSFLPAWWALDNGFYGLLIPTLINIASALKNF